MPDRLRLPTLVGFVLAFALALAFALPSAETAASSQLDSEELAFVTLINNYRQQNGLGPLAIDWELEGSSDWLSADMGQKAYFSHTDSLGRDPWTRMCDFGYCYNTWKGENIAGGFTTGAAVFAGWQNSPTHNAVMLGVDYTVIGVSRVYTAGSPYSWYWTSDFGGVQSNASPPASASTTPTPSPTATASPAQSPGAGCSSGTSIPSIPGDSDCDGFPDSVTAAGRASESKLGTDPARGCAGTSTPNDESSPDAWPMDFNDDRAINGQDSAKFAPAYNKLVSQGPFGPDAIPGKRFDLNGNGSINGQDTGKFLIYYGTICT